MKGIETQVLRVIQELGMAARGPRKNPSTSHSQIARKLVVSEEYAFDICQHLVEDGYLKNSTDGKFKLTEKSIKEISPVVSRGNIAVLKGGM
ncbi:hypothetical protein MYX84_09035 [Acidobacteria bacterium AH-259-O06]|nr:hypothetical protein [Acidobacteria bacterium AH-259-O06]